MAMSCGPFTRADYMKTPYKWRGELIDGNLIPWPRIPWIHTLVANRLIFRMLDHFGPAQNDRVFHAPADIFIDDLNVYQPDVFVLRERIDFTSDDQTFPIPLWVAEVLMEETAANDRGPKRDGYARAGVSEHWVFDAKAETIEVCDLVTRSVAVFPKHVEARSSVLEGFRLRFEELLAE